MRIGRTNVPQSPARAASGYAAGQTSQFNATAGFAGDTSVPVTPTRGQSTFATTSSNVPLGSPTMRSGSTLPVTSRTGSMVAGPTSSLLTGTMPALEASSSSSSYSTTSGIPPPITLPTQQPHYGGGTGATPQPPSPLTAYMLQQQQLEAAGLALDPEAAQLHAMMNASVQPLPVVVPTPESIAALRQRLISCWHRMEGHVSSRPFMHPVNLKVIIH
jgi:hypothetical protein